MSDMIKRVAQILEPQAWAGLAIGDTSLAYKSRRTSSLRKARAAIEAMRLPEGASSVPGGLAIEESMFASEDTVSHGAAKCWNAMIADVLTSPGSKP